MPYHTHTHTHIHTLTHKIIMKILLKRGSRAVEVYALPLNQNDTHVVSKTNMNMIINGKDQNDNAMVCDLNGLEKLPQTSMMST